MHPDASSRLSLLCVCDNIYTNYKDNNEYSGDLMLKREIGFDLMKNNNGLLKSKQATEAGIQDIRKNNIVCYNILKGSVKYFG